MSVIVFDIGGTLLKYEKMPLSWEDYYEDAFRELNKQFSCGVSGDEIARSVEILKSYNPRINYRENEIPPDVIFSDALKNWKITCSPLEASFSFYKNMNLKPEIFDDTIPVLTELKNRGFKIAALTDLPTGMSDDFFKADIAQLLPYFDFYVSSQSCGFRKPNPAGLKLIAEKFDVPLSELVFVGDEEKDRKAAENAGCRFFKIMSDGGEGKITQDENSEKITLHDLVNMI